MTKAVLRQACLQGADMSGINLEGADLRDGPICAAREPPRRQPSAGPRMDRAGISGLRGLVARFLDGASLRQVDLRGAYLRLARFDGADLSAADLRDTARPGSRPTRHRAAPDGQSACQPDCPQRNSRWPTKRISRC